MATKSPSPRKIPLEFEDVSSIDKPTESGQKAKVHGVITSLSPKKGMKFFDGCLSDGHKNIRLVGFSDLKKKSLEQFCKEKETIQLSNCIIKPAYSGGDELELIVNDSTTITKSNKKFSVDFPDPQMFATQTDTVKDISLSMLEDQPQFQKVSVKVKVLDVGETISLDDSRQVQSIIVADDTGTAKLSLWQDHVGALTLSKSYKLCNMMVKIYKEEHMLSTPKHGTIIDEVDGLPKVVSLVKQTKTLSNAKVIAVYNLSSQRLCLSCKKGHIVPMPDTPSLGRCSTCSTATLLSSCKLQTSALLTVRSQTFHYQLSAFGQQLANIAKVTSEEEVTDIALLMSAEFNAEYDAQMTLVSISRA